MVCRSSAIAFHNGTMEYIGSNSASIMYTNTMQSVIDRYIGQSPQYRKSTCTKPQPRESSSLSSIFQNVLHYFTTWRKGGGLRLAADPLSTPVHPNVQLFREEIENLAPFVHMTSKQRSELWVALTFPGWLTDTEELCQIADAAQGIFRGIFVAEHSSAAYTAMGYELCRTPDDAFNCQGPGRITTVDIQNNHLTSITLSKTPILSWMQLEAISAVSQGMNKSAMVKWVESFVSNKRSDLVMITGPGARDQHLLHLIEHSQIGRLAINQSSIATDKVAVMGAAQFAKDTLERRFTGCWELPDCLDIRREADRIAGKFDPPSKPSVWSLLDGPRLHHEL